LFAPLEGLRNGLEIVVCENRMHDGLQVLDGALIASGTATLEAALFEVPMVVVYRTSWPTYLAARAVVRVEHIAMANLIAGRAVVPECVQRQATPSRIARALVDVLRSPERRAAMQEALRKVKAELGPPGSVDRAAKAVLEELRTSP
jgi:lipid-A-disaccharide synthase